MNPSFLKDRLFLFVLLIVFICLKIPHLTLAYYWDESWPYVPAIFQMFARNISLLPGAVDPVLSRGHPLMFHALGAAWLHLFGTSHLSFHSFALFIAVCCLILVYEAGLRLFNKQTAMIASLLLATEVLFFVQSSLVLLELFIGFLAFAALYFYATRRFLITGIVLTMLFYTKESGMVLAGVLGIDAVIRFF